MDIHCAINIYNRYHNEDLYNKYYNEILYYKEEGF